MNVLQKSIIVTAGSILVSSVLGCAATPVPQDLLDARSAYQRAQSGPATQYKPDQLHEAKVALDKAEAEERAPRRAVDREEPVLADAELEAQMRLLGYL
jgi:hypothetical protein